VDDDAAVTKKITPFLWFDGRAEEAANFYVSVFENGKITSASPMSVSFELEGQEFIGLNGGPEYTFTPAVSFSIDCKTQAEVDHFWDRLSEGGKTSRCGWLEDKFGLSWQVVPSLLPELLQDDDDKKSDAVMQAMLKMTKLDVNVLQEAYDRA
jgi:predicted 3-demethylubiquinone-9 3-methyltransferase (glyoxalase superfamily)